LLGVFCRCAEVKADKPIKRIAKIRIFITVWTQLLPPI
jgi:hypothetical protein